ncbi:MAG TPA: ATP-binding protein [Parafilimonas sp.]|nr:ATP-binding protein [Parafilimonas sp.]
MHSEEAKVYIALLIAATVLAIILALFILATLRQQKKHRQLQQEKINAEIKALENERRRVARDLHDEVAVILSVAKVELSAIEETDKTKSKSLLKACNYIDDGLEKIRAIARDLMPVALEKKGLISALGDFFESINDTQTLIIEYDLLGLELNLVESAQIHIYRIVQEIIHNSLKYSGASKIWFDLKRETASIAIDIKDNGKGFNQAKVIKENNGLGLHNIYSRVELLGGDMYLDTDEEKGVNYHIEIPIKKSYE